MFSRCICTYNRNNNPKLLGTLTNETKCLTCETVKSKDEDFIDISVDIEQNTSITACLNDFSSSETLTGTCKYSCEECGGKTEGIKRLRVSARYSFSWQVLIQCLLLSR